jgi:hypothetical protein
MLGHSWEKFLLTWAVVQAKIEKDQRSKEKERISTWYLIIKKWELISSSKYSQSLKLNSETSIKWAKANDRAQTI